MPSRPIQNPYDAPESAIGDLTETTNWSPRFNRAAVWFLVVIALFVFGNLPRDGGTLISYLVWAGYPWTFAFWDSGRLESFSIMALAGNIAVAVACAVAAAYLCVRFGRQVD